MSEEMKDRPTFTVDELAQEIRRVDGDRSLGAGALAEALTPFLLEKLSAYSAFSLSERQKMVEALGSMLLAIKNGQIDSPELDGDPEAGIPPHRWHEEWAHHAAALTGSREQ